MGKYCETIGSDTSVESELAKCERSNNLDPSNNNNNNIEGAPYKSQFVSRQRKVSNQLAINHLDCETKPVERQNQHSNRFRKRNGMRHSENDTDSDDWHLLDAEEQVVSCKMGASSERGSLEAENGLNKANNEQPLSPAKYVNINPLDEQQKYSSRLIRTYMAMYALIPLASLIAFNVLLCLLFTKYWYITVVYYSYVFLDRNTWNTGGRRIEMFYRSKFWSLIAAYFPIQLRYSKNFKLNPNENYILNYHPHGISAFGCVAAFGTNGLNLANLFPEITFRFMVHETLFSVPIMREIFSARGDCSVNSKSFDYILSQKHSNGKAGNLLALVAGGLAEADLSNATVLKTVVAKRKGFVKKALIHGAHLVPCIAFGENSVFNKVDFKPGSFMHRFETVWYNLFKFKHPIYYGEGFLNHKLNGIMPFRRPITVVIGDPILVSRNEKPTNEDVNSVHAQYLDGLKTLYETNKDLCDKYDKVLEFV